MGKLVVLGLALMASCSLDREPVSSRSGSGAAMGSTEGRTSPADVSTDAAEVNARSPHAGVGSDDAGGRICDTDATCDDGDPCTADHFSIEVESCDVQCSNVPITRLKSGDGCCPAGANRSEDSDCDATCGDGLRDDGEECDGEAFCDERCRFMFAASLVHRYSFNDAGRAAFDSVGDADAVLAGTDLGGDGEVVLQGDRAEYVTLPAGLLSALTSASIEVWLTWRGGDIWQRVFDFGNHGESDDGEVRGTSFWYLTPRSQDETMHTRMNFTPAPWDSENDYAAEGSAPLSAGELHQVVATFDDGGKTLRLYVDGELDGEARDVHGRLAAIDDLDLWIGRSQFETDPPLDASVLELRIYDSALTARAVERSFELGPDPERASPDR